jgi:hypothetical protein
MMRFVLFSPLAFCKEMTAQTAAGIQPISVICNNRQIMPVKILPLKKKDNQGMRMAISVMASVICDVKSTFFYFAHTTCGQVNGAKKANHFPGLSEVQFFF